MNVYDQNGHFKGQIAKNINKSNFEYSVNLEEGKTYYIEYVFSEEAWKHGYSLQEYDIVYKSVSDSTSDSKCVRYAQNNNTTYVVPNLIDYTVEQELDKYENTRIIAKTEPFIIKTYKEPIYQNGIVTGYEKKYTTIEANIVLEKRKDLNIELTTRVSNVKIVLSNGNVFLENKIEENSDFWSVENQKYIFMNNYIMYGSKVYIEYEIKIKNKGNTTGNTFTILDYLNNYEGMTLTYDPNEKLISDTGQDNKAQGWEIYDKAPPNNYETNSDIILSNTLKIEKGKQEVTKRLVVSQLIATNTEPMYQNDVAVISYNNNQKQRNGDYNNYKRAGTEELLDSSEAIYILIPFGGSLIDRIFIDIRELFSIY